MSTDRSHQPSSADKHNLPAQRSSFVGREQDMLEVKRELEMTRLLTLTGVGGSGKTRLAVEVAREFAEAYPDGVWLVDYGELGDRERAAAALSELGRISLQLEDWETARSFLEQSLKLERELDDEHGIAVALESLGWLAHFEGNNAAARPLLEEALALFGRLGDSLYVGICLYLLGSIATDQGDYATARAQLVEIAEKAPLMQYQWAIPRYLEGWSVLAAAQGQAVRALRMAGAAAALRESIGASQMPAWHSHVARRLEPARRSLDGEEDAAAFEEGRAMTLEQALAYALESVPEAMEPTLGRRPPKNVLSARELEVLRLVAEGLTDARVADRLYLSRHTVGNHLRAVYRKLGARGRAAAVN